MEIRSNLKKMPRPGRARAVSRRSLCRLLAVSAVTLAFCANGAWAQVRQMQGGTALDASPMIGSGGLNAARPVTSGINGNLYVTGNVTGGRSFRGFSPITDSSALQITMPSATLSPFVRDSVALPTINYGLSTYVPRPYFDPSQTTVTAGAIEAQTLLPRDTSGTYRTGRGQYQMSVASLTAVPPISQYAGQLPYAAPGWSPAGVGMFNPDIVATTPGQVSPNPLTSYTVAGPLAVSQAEQPPLERPQLSGPGAWPLESGEAAQSDEVSSPPPTGPAANLAPPSAAPTARPAAQGLPAQQAGSSLLAQMQQSVPAGPPGQPASLQQIQQPAQQQPLGQNTQQPLDLSVSAAAQRPSDQLRNLRSGATAQQRQQLLTDVERQQAAQLLQQRLATPIRSLAGTRQTQVDRMLALAEQQMHKNEYYQAAGTYSGVITAAPDNALAWLGRANALLAAGEYLQAYVALSQGIERFPNLLEFDFDLPALIGNKEILDIRRAELEKMLAANPDYRMRFLLGYLEYYSGLRDLGLQTIGQAARSSPADSIVSQANQVLQRRGGPTSRPS